MTIYGRSEELVSRCIECDLAQPESLTSLGGSAPGVVDGILSIIDVLMEIVTYVAWVFWGFIMIFFSYICFHFYFLLVMLDQLLLSVSLCFFVTLHVSFVLSLAC